MVSTLNTKGSLRRHTFARSRAGRRPATSSEAAREPLAKSALIYNSFRTSEIVLGPALLKVPVSRSCPEAFLAANI